LEKFAKIFKNFKPQKWKKTKKKKKKTRMSVSGGLIDMVDKDNIFLNNIITGDERWCFFYDPQTIQQSSEWKSLSPRRSKSFRVERGKGKVMFIFYFFFLCCQVIVNYDFIPESCE